QISRNPPKTLTPPLSAIAAKPLSRSVPEGKISASGLSPILAAVQSDDSSWRHLLAPCHAT
ncbi:hypothetical protein BaRGS_00022143, partial [Batillaria attramentaria]